MLLCLTYLVARPKHDNLDLGQPQLVHGEQALTVEGLQLLDLGLDLPRDVACVQEVASAVGHVLFFFLCSSLLLNAECFMRLNCLGGDV